MRYSKKHPQPPPRLPHDGHHDMSIVSWVSFLQSCKKTCYRYHVFLIVSFSKPSTQGISPKRWRGTIPMVRYPRRSKVKWFDKHDSAIQVCLLTAFTSSLGLNNIKVVGSCIRVLSLLPISFCRCTRWPLCIGAPARWLASNLGTSFGWTIVKSSQVPFSPFCDAVAQVISFQPGIYIQRLDVQHWWSNTF